MLFRAGDRKKTPRAFTLVELLTVVVIVALLAASALGGVKGVRDRAAAGRAKTELAVIANALEEYRRYYGDYPQTGGTAQATAVVSEAIARSDAQACLFNALTGVYGPAHFNTARSGPTFLDLGKLHVEDPAILSSSTWGVPTGSPPAKPAVANALLDPWGQRYLYYYKPAVAPGSSPGETEWRASSFVLYSAGPNAAHVAPDPRTGLYATGTKRGGPNADNLYGDDSP